MGGLLHLPIGGAQIKIVNSIPEVPISGDTPLETIKQTLGTYTYAVATDGTYLTVSDLYDLWYEERPWATGDVQIINEAKHNGLTLVIADTNRAPKVNYLIINRCIPINSNRIIIDMNISESNWTTSITNLFFIPFNLNYTISDYVTLMERYLADSTDNPNNIQSVNLRHSGDTSINDEMITKTVEIATAGKYIIALKSSVTTYNGAPTVYNLNFRTY